MGCVTVDDRPLLRDLVDEYKKGADASRGHVEWPYWLKEFLFESQIAFSKGGLPRLSAYVESVHEDARAEYTSRRSDMQMLIFSVRLIDSVWGGYFNQHNLFMCKYDSDQKVCSRCAKTKSCSDWAIWAAANSGTSHEAGKRRMGAFLRLFVPGYDDRAAKILGLNEFLSW